MTMRFIGAMLWGVLLVLATTTGGFAQTGGWTPSASASSRDIAEHVATVRAEILYAKCKQQFGVDPNTLGVRGIQFRDGGMYAEWRQTHLTETPVLIRVLEAAGGCDHITDGVPRMLRHKRVYARL